MTDREIERRLARLEQRLSSPTGVQLVLDTPENRSRHANAATAQGTHDRVVRKNAQRRSNPLVVFVSEVELQL